MSSSSKQDPQHLAMPNEICTNINEEDATNFMSEEATSFDVVLSKSHVSTPFHLHVPSSMVNLLPRVKTPVVLSHGGKTWDTYYHGGATRPRFYPNWGVFVADNNLKLGDGVVFELIEKSSACLRFKVHILRDELPPELQAMVEAQGGSKKTAIEID